MEVVKKETNAVATAEEFDFIAEDFKIDSSDILIPKILLMQPTSVFVNDEVASLGEFRNSVNKEKVGSINEPFLFVPFHFTKQWDIINDDGDYIRKEAFNPGDENLPWEFKEGDANLKRIKRLDFFGFIPKKLEEGDTLPMILSFRSTGYREGTKILTQFKLNISKRKLPWSDVWSISGEKKKNESNQTYCVPKVDMVGDTSQEVQKTCMEWYKNIKSLASKIVVDDSDVQKEAASDAMKDVSDTGKF